MSRLRGGMVFAAIKKRLLPALLMFTLGIACFAHGYLAARHQIFPYRVIQDAGTAATALMNASQATQEEDAPAQYKIHVSAPTARTLKPSAGTELILMSGGGEFLKNHSSSGCDAWLMDRSGEVQHFWKHDSSLWANSPNVTSVPGISGDPYTVGLHLYDEGGLLASYQGPNIYPYAVGLAKFDVESRLVWKKELNAHHWVSVAPDGRIYACVLDVVESPVPIGKTDTRIVSTDGKILSDSVVILDPDGNVLDKISMIEALFDSGWAALLNRNTSDGVVQSLLSNDPLHLNDVRVVTSEEARWQPWLEAGDLLVSFRNLNAVGILDPDSRRFKWISSGASLAQHSPRMYDGGVLVLDNLGGDWRWGGTQLVTIPLDHGTPTVLFPKASVDLPDLCRTHMSGHIDLNRDGKRALVSLTHSGSVWEVDLTTGEVLWLYIHVQPDGDGTRSGSHTAKYVYDSAFLRNRE